MKIQTALHRLLDDPTLELTRLNYGQKFPTLVIRANVNEVAPSRDDIRWDSMLYVKGTKKPFNLSVRDYLTHDWTVRKPK